MIHLHANLLKILIHATIISQGLKIVKKKIVFEKNYWKIRAAHDGYFKTIWSYSHDRDVEFYPEQMKFIGYDNIISKNKIKNLKFEIRFHLEPNTKVMRTKDNKSILDRSLMVRVGNLIHNNNNIDIDNGLYFGKKNSFIYNQNIFITGMTNNENQTIKWEITKL